MIAARLRSGTALLVLLLALIALPRTSAAQTAAVPRFEAGPCAPSQVAALSEGAVYRCGIVVVPESWVAAPRTIKLAVTIVQSQALRPAPDPVVVLAGGPGDSGTGYARFLAPLLQTLDRDLIFVDQRGTGLSQPNLDCPEVDRASTQMLKKRLTGAAAQKVQVDALKACRTRLVKSGVDLNAYRTVQSAADIAALRAALGYESVNLYGVSYGTELAQEVMRSYPEGIRSVVLDSVVPPSWLSPAGEVKAMRYAFTHVFESCAAATTCNRQYPKLRSVFLDLVRRLDRKPVILRVWVPSEAATVKLPLTGEAFASGIYVMLKSGAIWNVPYTIWATAHGNMVPATNLTRTLTATGGGTGLGMNLSVVCAALQPYPAAAEITAAAKRLPSALRTLATGQLTALSDRCKLWKVSADSPTVKTPVHSAIPTLILGGEFDPTTPPFFGDTVAQTLDRSFAVVFPGLGHFTMLTGSCPVAIVAQFMYDPSHQPDNACVTRMTEPFS